MQNAYRLLLSLNVRLDECVRNIFYVKRASAAEGWKPFVQCVQLEQLKRRYHIRSSVRRIVVAPAQYWQETGVEQKNGMYSHVVVVADAPMAFDFNF